MVGEQVVDQVGIHTRPGEDTDRSIEEPRWMARIFEGFPCALEKMPVLRIHDGCISRTESEKRCIEHRDFIEHGCALDVIGVRQVCGSCPGRYQLGFRAVADGFDAIAQVVPDSSTLLNG